MNVEIISNVEIADDGELVLSLASGGKPAYAYVYRAAAGVRWDPGRHAFTFTTKNDGLYVKWFSHMLGTIKSEMGLRLLISEGTTWKNVADAMQHELMRAAD